MAAAIKRGLTVMAGVDVIMVALARDLGDGFKPIVSHVEQTGRMFRDYRVIIVEEDSKDKTAERLVEWSHRNNKVRVTSRRTGSSSAGPSRDEFIRGASKMTTARFERMSELRNSYLDLLRHDTSLTDTRFVIVFDSDVSGGWDMDGIAHSFGIRVTDRDAAVAEVVTATRYRRAAAGSWHAVCSNGRYRDTHLYYDSLAYIDQSMDGTLFREHQQVVHLMTDAPFLVGSCFGGLTIYDREALLACSYGLGSRNLTRHGQQPYGCEHHGLHECMVNNGHRILFNPRQIVNS